jgi:hypothetical protein
MERVIVGGSSASTVREAAGLSGGRVTVTITQDDRLEWTYQLASWRPLAVGSGLGAAWEGEIAPVLMRRRLRCRTRF